jgi:UrcA family protein
MKPMKTLIAGAATTAALGFTGAGYTAVPQTTTVSPQTEQIIIEAPRYVVKRLPVTGRESKLTNAEVVSISHPVGYSDLNLSKAEDAAILKKRVSDTATQICIELNSKYPKTQFRVVYGNEDCVKSAVDEALVVVNEVIAASAND